MHQHADAGNIIGMVAGDLEVIDMDGTFQDLVLDFFHNHIFAVDQHQNIARAKPAGLRPALYWRVEGMVGVVTISSPPTKTWTSSDVWFT